ncbi:MAG: hypothetical protein ACLFQE_07550, partial [Thermotogota bacterium]
MRSELPRIAILREKLGCFSETFIYSQALKMRRFESKFFGISYSGNSFLDRTNSYVLQRDCSHLSGIRTACYKVTGYSDIVKRGLAAYKPSLVHVHFGTDAARFLSSIPE